MEKSMIGITFVTLALSPIETVYTPVYPIKENQVYFHGECRATLRGSVDSPKCIFHHKHV